MVYVGLPQAIQFQQISTYTFFLPICFTLVLTFLIFINIILKPKSYDSLIVLFIKLFSPSLPPPHKIVSSWRLGTVFWDSQVPLVVKNLSANAGDIRDMDLIPGLGRYPGERHGNPLQYSCPEKPVDRGAWQAAVHGVTKRHDRNKLALHPSTQLYVWFLTNAW